MKQIHRDIGCWAIYENTFPDLHKANESKQVSFSSNLNEWVI